MSIPVVLRDCSVLDSSEGENTPTTFGQRKPMGLSMATVLNPHPSAAVVFTAPPSALDKIREGQRLPCKQQRPPPLPGSTGINCDNINFK